MGRITAGRLRILVAGGRGFLGGRISSYLAEMGHEIVIGSRTHETAPLWLPTAGTILMQWEDLRSLKEACQRVDVVINAAGLNSQQCGTDPVNALQSNGLGTARLVEAAYFAGVRRFIYISTAHVYANPLAGVITEETCPKNTHPYATSHLAGEHAVLHANTLGKLQGTVLRLSNAFGVPMEQQVNCWTLLANDLCRQAIEKGYLTLKTNGQQQRDFVPITDVCKVVCRLVDKSKPDVVSSILNLGSGRAYSVVDFARLIQTRCNQVLGFLPNLQKSVVAESGTLETLQFKVARMERLGLMNIRDLETEIDELLLYSRSAFSFKK